MTFARCAPLFFMNTSAYFFPTNKNAPQQGVLLDTLLTYELLDRLLLRSPRELGYTVDHWTLGLITAHLVRIGLPVNQKIVRRKLLICGYRPCGPSRAWQPGTCIRPAEATSYAAVEEWLAHCELPRLPENLSRMLPAPMAWLALENLPVHALEQNAWLNARSTPATLLSILEGNEWITTCKPSDPVQPARSVSQYGQWMREQLTMLPQPITSLSRLSNLGLLILLLLEAFPLPLHREQLVYIISTEYKSDLRRTLRFLHRLGAVKFSGLERTRSMAPYPAYLSTDVGACILEFFRGVLRHQGSEYALSPLPPAMREPVQPAIEAALRPVSVIDEQESVFRFMSERWPDRQSMLVLGHFDKGFPISQRRLKQALNLRAYRLREALKKLEKHGWIFRTEENMTPPEEWPLCLTAPGERLHHAIYNGDPPLSESDARLTSRHIAIIIGIARQPPGIYTRDILEQIPHLQFASALPELLRNLRTRGYIRVEMHKPRGGARKITLLRLTPLGNTLGAALRIVSDTVSC